MASGVGGAAVATSRSSENIWREAADSFEVSTVLMCKIIKSELCLLIDNAVSCFFFWVTFSVHRRSVHMTWFGEWIIGIYLPKIYYLKIYYLTLFFHFFQDRRVAWCPLFFVLAKHCSELNVLYFKLKYHKYLKQTGLLEYLFFLFKIRFIFRNLLQNMTIKFVY